MDLSKFSIEALESMIEWENYSGLARAQAAWAREELKKRSFLARRNANRQNGSADEEGD